MTVDEFVEKKVAPEFQAVVAAIRALMRECDPDAEELISYGMHVYKGNKIFAWINPPKKDVTFAFPRGVQMADEYGLLRVAAKGGTRHVRMRNLAEVNKPALKYYVKQAISLDRS